jgi:hypothetical protein
VVGELGKTALTSPLFREGADLDRKLTR